MILKDSIQTAFLVVGLFSLLVFGASYYFILIDPDSNNHPLKEALSITASFFGGFATLTAAFIGSKLFNDWRHQHKASFYEKYYYDLRNSVFEVYKSYLNLKTFLLDEYNQEFNEAYFDKFYPLEKDFLYDADFTLQVLNDFLYFLKKDNKIDYKKYEEYRKGLNETIAFFEVYDPRSDHLTYRTLIDMNIRNSKIEVGIQNLKHLLSLDILDDIHKTIK